MKNNLLVYLFVWLLIGCILTGCKVKRPSGVLSETKMEQLLYDYHVAKAMADDLPSTENYRKALYMDAVFAKHGTTEEVFDSSMVWYSRHTEILSRIYDKVADRLKEERDEINYRVAQREKKTNMSLPGDSIDVWVWQQVYRLDGTPFGNKVTFSLTTDTNYKERDTLLWNVRYLFVGKEPDTLRAPVMAMQIKFRNDSILSGTKSILNSGMHHIRLVSDTLGEIREVNGFIYYPGEEGIPMVLTDSISLMRYHNNDSIPASVADSLQTETADGAVVETLRESVTAAPVPDTVSERPSDFQRRSNPAHLNQRRRSDSIARPARERREGELQPMILREDTRIIEE
ncbi:MAG: DUF4296 domain-containing protein [Bacteroides sp.]|nr:DUF4296 domain-containing protein [Bacteroides sp.]